MRNTVNKVKISYDEWTEIGKYNYAAKWLRNMCDYTLVKESDTKFRREQRVGLFPYLLIFIPVHILQALLLMWDGGLKEFEFAERYLGSDLLQSGSFSFAIAEEIWNDKLKK